MEYGDFYDIAEYGNANWKGNFTPKEIACNAYDYLVEKANGFKHDRSKGGHEVWEKTITDSISIPVHGDINGGIARRLIREHRLKE